MRALPSNSRQRDDSPWESPFQRSKMDGNIRPFCFSQRFWGLGGIFKNPPYLLSFFSLGRANQKVLPLPTVLRTP